MPIIRQVAQLGNDILRKTANEVKDITSPSIQLLIEDLLATVSDANGVGIAAPQVYEPLQIFIMASYPNPRYPDAPEMEPTAIVNPKILMTSDEMEKDWEGCLSVPGIRGLVPRHKRIGVKYTTGEGTTKEQEFSDFLARLFQHEYDHLNGIAFLDRLESTKDIITEKEFQKRIS
jgi:peptide deformylase